ncbi:tyrosine-type recombinase/integrase [Lysobacter gummosus]|uniref:tyrosine-type recombinase/integrase n=1 Tax=Lysobacter gummosus TaxID=262324 RepID=UPI00363FFBFE
MSDIVDFAIGTGKRESEITRLLWEDLDLTTRTALLRDAKHPRDKDGNHQRFPLLGDMWELVQRQPRTHTKIFPYNSKSVGTAFRRNCVALGIKNLTFHDLRHEATSRLFEQGYAIEQVAAVTLHRSWEELKRYTQLRPETLHRDELSQRRKSWPFKSSQPYNPQRDGEALPNGNIYWAELTNQLNLGQIWTSFML